MIAGRSGAALRVKHKAVGLVGQLCVVARTGGMARTGALEADKTQRARKIRG